MFKNKIKRYIYIQTKAVLDICIEQTQDKQLIYLNGSIYTLRQTALRANSVSAYFYGWRSSKQISLGN